MKSKTTLFFLLSLCCITVIAQSSWTNYANDRLIDDVLVVGDDVWVGSQGGLTRTIIQTGEFQTYLAYNSPIKGGGIIEMEKAPDNSLWFISENAGIFHVKNGEWINYYADLITTSYYNIKNLQILPNGDVWFFLDLPEDESPDKLARIRDGVVETFGNLPEDVRSIAIADEHTIFISTGDTIHQYDASIAQVTKKFHSGNSIISSDDIFREIITDKNGTLILATATRILQLENGIISVLSTPGVDVYKAFKDEAGKVVYLQTYLNELNGIRLVKYDGTTITYLKDEDFEPYPVSDSPRFIGADIEGNLYAVLWNVNSEYTLFRFDGNSWTPVKTQIYPLLDNYQDDVQSDCDGNLWFGSRDGVDVRYADGTWQNFSVEVSPQTYFIVGQMTVDPITCDVWFTNISNSGNSSVPGIIRISNGIVTYFLRGHSNVYDIEATREGKIYFFSGNSGLGYIENDVIHYIDQLDESNFITSIDSDSKGNLYLAAWGATLLKYDGTNVIHLGAGELHQYVNDVYVDNDDLVWVRFSGGYKLFDGIHWMDYSDVWPDNTLSGIVQDRKGNYWVSTWNDGLYYWDKQTVQHYDIFNSDLSTNKLHSVALDPSGNLIVTQWVGVSVLDIPDLTESYRGTGTVFFDYEKNGSFDQAKDVLVPGQKISDTDRHLWAVTNTYGTYAFYSQNPETITYQHELEPNAESTNGNSQSADFADYQSVLPDFGFWKPYVPDVSVNILHGVPVCNRDFRVHIFLQNKSTYTTTGHLTFNFNSLLTFKESSIPVSQETDGQIVISDLSIEPFGIIDIRLDFTAPGLTTDPIPLFFEGIFATADHPFVGTTMDSVVCSYDPNDKKVEPTGEFIHNYSLIADPLKYTIRFQNEGTYKAFDITIIDTLDQHLDPSTFQLLGSSHLVETTITAEGIVTFVFRNIDLPTRSDDALESQGFVSFTVRPDGDLTGMERIMNKANIYFDFNPPIVTNTTQWNVVDNLAIVSTKEVYGHMSINPNPTQGTLLLTTDKEASYYIWDGAGRHINAGKLQSGSNSIHLDIPSGIYYLQMYNGDEVYEPFKIVVIR